MTADRLAQALERELIRRKVTSLPHKAELMGRLGLESLDAVHTWMWQTSDMFEMAAQDYIAAARSQAPAEGDESEFDWLDLPGAVAAWNRARRAARALSPTGSIAETLNAAAALADLAFKAQPKHTADGNKGVRFASDCHPGEGVMAVEDVHRLLAAQAPAPAPEPAPWVPYLSDRADGVAGHYAIARWNPAGYREVWNLRNHRWASASDDVLCLEEADSLLRQIVIPTVKPAPVPQTFTEGHCAEKRKPGGCQLHNLHCGYPKCDRKPAAPAPCAAVKAGPLKRGTTGACSRSLGCICERDGLGDECIWLRPVASQPPVQHKEGQP